MQKSIPELFICTLLLLSSLSLGQDTLSPITVGYTNILDDWEDQDSAATKGYRSAIQSIAEKLASADRALVQQRLSSLSGSDSSVEMKELYTRACSARRIMRMSAYRDRFQKVIFSQHQARGGAYFYADYPNAGGYQGKGLELLQMDGYYGTVSHLLPNGEARDPNVSFDGKRVLFSWRGGSSGSSRYHLFEMNLDDRTTRRITSDPKAVNCDDIEGIYLPNGNIIFNSTRIVQEIDCINGAVANLFLCDKDGRYVRRIGFDQVPTNYPQVLPSGEVVYCRWDYNDKSHTYAHALFVMNPDGTAQREYYNNNSWWPTMILQQRPIPGTSKLMAMIGGYHSRQSGKIGIIDNSVGLANGLGVTLLAPVRTPGGNRLDPWGGIPSRSNYPWQFDTSALPLTNARPLDTWGQKPPMFAYPYPFDEQAFLVSFRPAAKESAWSNRFGLYFMLADGQRELLYFDSTGSCCAPVAVTPRPVPPVLSSTVDYRKNSAVCQVMDINIAQPPLLQGVARGTIKRLRVAYLSYRTGPARGGSKHFGPGCINYGGATYHTAIATDNASWDAKGIIGETPVHSDGSASFIVPARTPLFFQALDGKGQVVQTMRSWATLQPGETFTCTGCHESKLTATPPPSTIPIALRNSPVALETFYGPQRSFSFRKEIQPILDAKCVSCHNATTPNGIDLSSTPNSTPGTRAWNQSYLNLVTHTREASSSKYVNWFHAEDSPLLQPPYRAGSCKSSLLTLLEQGHKDVAMSKDELDKIRCWIDLGVPHSGDYEEGMNDADRKATEQYLNRRKAWEAEEQTDISAMVGGTSPVASPATSASSYATSLAYNGAYPNPFRATTSIRFTVHADPTNKTGKNKVSLAFYNAEGRLVRSIVKNDLSTGSHLLTFDGRDSRGNMLSPGLYLCTIRSHGQQRAFAMLRSQ